MLLLVLDELCRSSMASIIMGHHGVAIAPMTMLSTVLLALHKPPQSSCRCDHLPLRAPLDELRLYDSATNELLVLL